ncbi:MAG: metallophosphoesterase [Helicobacteraceae bacterium]|nr:metallophosphoesterase [Helicobacteraceae bacterium]
MAIAIVAYILLAASVWYVPFSLKKLLGFQKVWPWHLLLAAVLGGYMLVLFKGIYALDSVLAAIVYNVLGVLFVFFIYLFFLLIAAYPLTLLSKRIAKRPLGIGVIAACGLLVIFGFINAQFFTVTHYDVPLNGLAQPVKIAHIPDIHLGSQRGESYLKKILSVIDEEKPDIVLYNGDLIESNIALKRELFALFSNVQTEQYFTTGNHEYYVDTDRTLQFIADAGIRILRSEMIETHGIQLIGMEYMNADRETYDAHVVNTLTIQEELPRITRNGDVPSILIHHSPVGMRYAAEGNIDVMLSGHTHGGQFFPGTALIKFRFPMYSGRYEIDRTTLIVSQGAGTFGPWIRLGTQNEVQIVNLIPVK